VSGFNRSLTPHATWVFIFARLGVNPSCAA
jgi:hypothetical protein